MSAAPCKGCPDRYLACSDHCRKPEFMAWKEENRRRREVKLFESGMLGYTVGEIHKNRKKTKRRRLYGGKESN